MLSFLHITRVLTSSGGPDVVWWYFIVVNKSAWVHNNLERGRTYDNRDVLKQKDSFCGKRKTRDSGELNICVKRNLRSASNWIRNEVFPKACIQQRKNGFIKVYFEIPSSANTGERRTSERNLPAEGDVEVSTIFN